MHIDTHISSGRRNTVGGMGGGGDGDRSLNCTRKGRAIRGSLRGAIVYGIDIYIDTHISGRRRNTVGGLGGGWDGGRPLNPTCEG